MEKAKKNARTVSENRAGKSVLWDIPYALRVNFYLRGFLMAACAERYSGRTFWTTAPYPSNCMAYDPSDNFPPFMSFTIKFDEAEAYRKAIGCYLRKNQWEDITVDVYL